MAAGALNPTQTALILVGMQNDYCSPDGVKARAGHNLTRVQEAAHAIARMVGECRRAGFLTVFVRNEHGVEDAAMWQRRRRVALSPMPAGARTWGAEFYLPVADSDIVVTKRRYSAFTGTALETLLRSEGRNTVAIAGVQTHVSVLSTAISACDHDFSVYVVEDAVAAYSDEATEWALRTVAGHFGRLTTCADLVRYATQGALGG
ncbi:MAG: cysteine hydrolase [Firmicutes bacterium]|nr:cysteine hydrolase [Bacillota bacterium]